MVKRYGMPVVVRIDKNGTKYWVDRNCSKCGGEGHLPYYGHIQGGVCFQCGGSGEYSHSWKEYTPEYTAKLLERRMTRLRKKNIEQQADWLFAQGFNECDSTYVIVGNTYEIRDELKKHGAKYSPFIGWHMLDKPENFVSVKLTVKDCFTEHPETAALEWREQIELEKLINERTPHDDASTSEYIGEVGKRMTVKVTLVKSFSFENYYSYYPTESYIHNFIDEAGNVFIWKTVKAVPSDSRRIILTGTVKEHSDYKGVKQTILTRCKIA